MSATHGLFAPPGSDPVFDVNIRRRVGGAKRKSCNCRNSRCLKLYCECFAGGQYCFACNCQGCFNNPENDEKRLKAIEQTLERNPSAFRPKIAHAHGEAKADAAEGGESASKHNKGCHCKKSGCLKKYCECFQAGILCTPQCKCSGCKNVEGNEQRAALVQANKVPTPVQLAKKARLAGTPAAAAARVAKRKRENLGESPMVRSRDVIARVVTDALAADMCAKMLAEAPTPTPLERARMERDPLFVAAPPAKELAEKHERHVLETLHGVLEDVLARAAIAALPSIPPPRLSAAERYK